MNSSLAELRRAETVREGARILTICNACRYCEGYCAVFPAMEQRLAFPAGDLHYLANLCHNCGECLYACQYAPPHGFAINVPRTLAELRLQSYEEYAWPSALSRAFRRHSVASSLAVSMGMIVVMLLVTTAAGSARLRSSFGGAVAPGDFYSVLPHLVMVTLFGAVFAFALVALAVGLTRFRREAAPGPLRATRPTYAASWAALRDVLTLKNLHAHGTDCTYTAEEARTRWRRWFHHLTFYGFGLCFAATSVAAIYHSWFGWEAPYGYTSVPVILGTFGGVGLLVGPAGLYWLGRRRDPATADPAQRPLDQGFALLLFLSSITGLVLLAWRDTAAMSTLLIVHLGVVLALFVTLPYGKFVHGIYRAAALVRHAQEGR